MLYHIVASTVQKKMNLSGKDFGVQKDNKLKITALNPNAAEFVPSSIKYTYGSAMVSETRETDFSGSIKKASLDRSESTDSNNSDDETHRYWRNQLPDDITPDFKVMVEEEMQKLANLSLEALSLHDDVKSSSLSASMANHTIDMRQHISSIGNDNLSYNEKNGFPGSAYDEDQLPTAFVGSAATSWTKPLLNGVQNSISGMGEHHYNGDYADGLVYDMFGDNAILQKDAVNPIKFLSLQFPGFAVQSLADVYYGNGCDLNSTIEILTQLELQVDSSLSQNPISKPLVSPSLSMLDFPALPLALADAQSGFSKFTGDAAHQASYAFRSSSSSLRSDINFASAVKKVASQDSGCWRNERSSVTDAAGVGSSGSSRSSQLLASSHNVYSKMSYGDKFPNTAGVRSAPIWLETGEAVGNMYSESREEARDFARLRNACFEQARQAYLIGNKALAKELSTTGQLYNMQMKAAHERAREAIYHQRNPLSELHSYRRGQDHLIDLHGLHVTEAIHVLNHELSSLRSTARSMGQRLPVMICVGTGHHTKGSRTPARLPVAVEHYLLEEGLHFTQPQPGLLRVIIY